MVSTGSVSGTLTHAGGAPRRLNPRGQPVTADNVLTDADIRDMDLAITGLIAESQTPVVEDARELAFA